MAIFDVKKANIAVVLLVANQLLPVFSTYYLGQSRSDSSRICNDISEIRV